ncbi:MAG: EscU/YscU/HrcU family type III secretion system export apparatus switch protein [Verrucomicrobiales bacterium]|nr:EscU/YscU/HrcU family type III secretion system export apparatus switch protein [Verrucomicrobiales bacterium]
MAGSEFSNRRAVALFYEQEQTPLPRVVAKGEAHLAARMIEAAQEAGVPIMQDVGLATTLYHDVHLDHYIPTELIEPVAAVLNWVRKIKEEGASY